MVMPDRDVRCQQPFGHLSTLLHLSVFLYINSQSGLMLKNAVPCESGKLYTTNPLTLLQEGASVSMYT